MPNNRIETAQEAIADLLDNNIIREGDTLYAITRYKAQNSMRRYVSFLVILPPGRLYGNEDIRVLYLNYPMSLILKVPQVEKRGYFCLYSSYSGDVALDFTQKLSYRLFGKDFALKSQWL